MDLKACLIGKLGHPGWVPGEPPASSLLRFTSINMTTRHHARSLGYSAFVFGALAILSTGCAGLQVPELKLKPLPFVTPQSPRYQGIEPGFELQTESAEEIYHSVREATARNAVVLQVVGDSSPVRVLPLPRDGRSVTVSNLLTQTGVSKKLGTIEATLFRPATGMIGGLPLEIELDHGHSVRPESDYALRPGDRLRVRKAVSPQLKTALESLLML